MRITILPAYARQKQYFYAYSDRKEYKVDYIEEKLRKRFPSINFLREKRIFRHFKFKNKSDEAYFILWINSIGDGKNVDI